MTNILEQSYEEFISQFPVYDSQYQARAKGFEAHHIVPKSTQGEKCDDRCVRLSPFEHILAHYLYSKEHPEDYKELHALSRMCKQNARKLLEDENLFIAELPNIKEMSEKGVLRGSQLPQFGKEGTFKGRHHTEESRQKISEAHKGKNHTEQWKKAQSERMKGRVLSDEWKAKIGKANKGKPNSQLGKKRSEEWKKMMLNLHEKKVYRFSLTGDLECIYNSVKEAAETLNVHPETIRVCCLKNKGLRKSSFFLSYTNYMNKEPNE